MKHCWKILFCFLMLLSSGCVHHGKYSIGRVWVDWNSYAEPTISYEREDHLPYYSPRIDHFRWMYGKGPSETPARVLYGLAQPVSYESSSDAQLLNEPTPVLAPALSVELPLKPVPDSQPLPPPRPASQPSQSSDQYDLVGYTTKANAAKSQRRTFRRVPRKSWMFTQ